MPDELVRELVAMLENRCHELGGDSEKIVRAILAHPEIADALRLKPIKDLGTQRRDSEV